MDNTYTNSSESITRGSAYNSYSNGYCQYRLPCGYCEKLARDCPKIPTNYNVTITNQVSVKGDK